MVAGVLRPTLDMEVLLLTMFDRGSKRYD